jgi:class 3 adenylate cyclase
MSLHLRDSRPNGDREGAHAQRPGKPRAWTGPEKLHAERHDPESRPGAGTDTRRAARAGLAMQRAVLSLPDPAGRPMFRVGINSGPALVGNIGAADVRNFSAIGDTTNLAARLQTYAPVGSVVIGARTYELIQDIADVRSLGTPALKGKSEAVEVYELVGLRDDRGARSLEHREAPASGGS